VNLLFELNEYKKSFDLLLKLIDIYEEVYGTFNENYLEILMLLGILYLTFQDDKNSMTTLEKCLHYRCLLYNIPNPLLSAESSSNRNSISLDDIRHPPANEDELLGETTATTSNSSNRSSQRKCYLSMFLLGKSFILQSQHKEQIEYAKEYQRKAKLTLSNAFNGLLRLESYDDYQEKIYSSLIAESTNALAFNQTRLQRIDTAKSFQSFASSYSHNTATTNNTSSSRSFQKDNTFASSFESFKKKKKKVDIFDNFPMLWKHKAEVTEYRNALNCRRSNDVDHPSSTSKLKTHSSSSPLKTSEVLKSPSSTMIGTFSQWTDSLGIEDIFGGLTLLLSSNTSSSNDSNTSNLQMFQFMNMGFALGEFLSLFPEYQHEQKQLYLLLFVCILLVDHEINDRKQRFYRKYHKRYRHLKHGQNSQKHHNNHNNNSNSNNNTSHNNSKNANNIKNIGNNDHHYENQEEFNPDQFTYNEDFEMISFKCFHSKISALISKTGLPYSPSATIAVFLQSFSTNRLYEIFFQENHFQQIAAICFQLGKLFEVDGKFSNNHSPEMTSSLTHFQPDDSKDFELAMNLFDVSQQIYQLLINDILTKLEGSELVDGNAVKTLHYEKEQMYRKLLASYEESLEESKEHYRYTAKFVARL
jgi:hypothetical protein